MEELTELIQEGFVLLMGPSRRQKHGGIEREIILRFEPLPERAAVPSRRR